MKGAGIPEEREREISLAQHDTFSVGSTAMPDLRIRCFLIANDLEA